jgi:hypothetical protein
LSGDEGIDGKAYYDGREGHESIEGGAHDPFAGELPDGDDEAERNSDKSGEEGSPERDFDGEEDHLENVCIQSGDQAKSRDETF